MKPCPTLDHCPECRCPECGSPMELRHTRKFTYADGRSRPFYGCSRWPHCTATHGAHPDGRPLGTPADAATKLARMAAHEAFDRLWKPALGGTMRRKEAYRLMQSVMGLSAEAAHIGRFTAEQCRTLIDRLAPSKVDVAFAVRVTAPGGFGFSEADEDGHCATAGRVLEERQR